MKFRLLLFTVVCCFALTSCMKDTEVACDFNACAVVAPQAEIDQVQTYLTASSIQATQHCSGLFYKIESEGSGAKPTACSDVEITYQGKFTNGNKFDETSRAVAFNLQQLIRSWQIGLPLIKAGGKIHLYVPPTLGYGSVDRRDNAGNLVIPANSVLIFEISLLGVR